MRRKEKETKNYNILEVYIMETGKYYVVDGIRYSEKEYNLVFKGKLSNS